MSRKIFSLTALPPGEKKSLGKSKSAPSLLGKESKNVVSIPNGKSLADSPRTKEALKKLGIMRKDLIPKPLDKFAAPGIKPQIQRLRFEFHEKHRQELVKRVKAERKKIISRGWNSATRVGLSPEKLEKIIAGEETYVQQKMQEKRKKFLARKFNEELCGFDRRNRGKDKVLKEEKIVQRIKKKRTDFSKERRKLNEARSVAIDQNLEIQEKKEQIRMKNMMKKLQERDQQLKSLKSFVVERKIETGCSETEFQKRQKKKAQQLKRGRKRWEDKKRKGFFEKEKKTQQNVQKKQNKIRQKQAARNQAKAERMEKLQAKRIKMKQQRENKLTQQITQVQARIAEIERKREKRKKEMKAASKVDDRKREVEEMKMKKMKEREKKFVEKEREAEARLRQLEEQRLLEQEMKKEENRLHEERQRLAKLQKERAGNYNLDRLQEKIQADTNKYVIRKKILCKITQERRVINELGALARQELKHTLSHAGEDVLGNPHKLASITSKIPQRFAIDYAPPRPESRSDM